MLQFLRVTDFVLFGRTEIEFAPRLNVISGETGAGKSLLLGAVELLLGGEASVRQIRTGADKAVVEGLFTLSGETAAQLKQSGILDSEADNEVVIRREVSSSGRSRCFINGSMANLGMLSALGEELIQVHGQHDHQRLMRQSHQLALLDAFGSLDSRREEFSGLVTRYRSLSGRIRELEEDLERHSRELELARFQREEIDRAEVSIEEEKELEEELSLLENAEQIGELLARLRSGLEEDPQAAGAGEVSVQGMLGSLRRAFDQLAGLTDRAGGLLESFDSARFTLDEVSSGLRELESGLDHDPARLDELRQRQDELYRLKKKYGPSLEDVLAFRERLEQQLAGSERDESELSGMREQKSGLEAGLREKAESLGRQRRAAARRLEKEVGARLEGLGMKGGRFEVAFERAVDPDKVEEYPATGNDRVCFMLSTNPGVPLMPLADVASGGELSRIMLAIKSALAETEAPAVMIFDEVDAGIGGKVGTMVGRYLSEIAARHQVLVITHLAQIAGFADCHMVVEKSSTDRRTETVVRRLENVRRPGEIARMLGGDPESDTSLAHARQILERSGRGID